MDCAREWLPLLRTRLAALLAAFTGFTSPIAVTGHSQSQRHEWKGSRDDQARAGIGFRVRNGRCLARVREGQCCTEAAARTGAQNKCDDLMERDSTVLRLTI
jgi:hypothetical protein